MNKIISLVIKIYQKVAHAFFPPTCRFYPSCSDYALQAIEKYGTCKGLAKTLYRIVRCSPVSKGGYDPVR